LVELYDCPLSRGSMGCYRENLEGSFGSIAAFRCDCKSKSGFSQSTATNERELTRKRVPRYPLRTEQKTLFKHVSHSGP